MKSRYTRTNMVILSLKMKIHDQNETILELRKQNAKLKNQNAIMKQSGQEIRTETPGEREPTGGIALSERVSDEICCNIRIMRKGNRRCTDLLSGLAFVLYASSAKVCRFVRLLIPLLSMPLLYQRLGSKIRFLKDRITTLDGIASVCQTWRTRKTFHQMTLFM
jgi:FtsZ-interacting cell division protein YlmF